MRNFSFDIIGDIAVLKFPEGTRVGEKKKSAKRFLEGRRNIQTVLEKSDRVKGRLRIAKSSFLAGEDKRDTVYVENNCRFKLNVDETYFSPRLANQRQKIAEDLVGKMTKNKNKILVMFAGVAPFPIVIAKKLKSVGKKAEIVSNEINRKASKYAEENIGLNKLKDYVCVVQGDSKKLHLKLNQKFDFILMPRPNLKDTFLESAFKFTKKGTRIYYYGFGDKEKVLSEVRRDSGSLIKSIQIKKAGEIAPYKFRWLVEFVVR